MLTLKDFNSRAVKYKDILGECEVLYPKSKGLPAIILLDTKQESSFCISLNFDAAFMRNPNHPTAKRVPDSLPHLLEHILFGVIEVEDGQYESFKTFKTKIPNTINVNANTRSKKISVMTYVESSKCIFEDKKKSINHDIEGTANVMEALKYNKRAYGNFLKDTPNKDVDDLIYTLRLAFRIAYTHKITQEILDEERNTVMTEINEDNMNPSDGFIFGLEYMPYYSHLSNNRDLPNISIEDIELASKLLRTNITSIKVVGNFSRLGKKSIEAFKEEIIKVYNDIVSEIKDIKKTIPKDSDFIIDHKSHTLFRDRIKTKKLRPNFIIDKYNGKDMDLSSGVSLKYNFIEFVHGINIPKPNTNDARVISEYKYDRTLLDFWMFVMYTGMNSLSFSYFRDEYNLIYGNRAVAMPEDKCVVYRFADEVNPYADVTSVTFRNIVDGFLDVPFKLTEEDFARFKLAMQDYLLMTMDSYLNVGFATRDFYDIYGGLYAERINPTMFEKFNIIKALNMKDALDYYKNVLLKNTLYHVYVGENHDRVTGDK